MLVRTMLELTRAHSLTLLGRNRAAQLVRLVQREAAYDLIRLLCPEVTIPAVRLY